MARPRADWIGDELSEQDLDALLRPDGGGAGARTASAPSSSATTCRGTRRRRDASPRRTASARMTGAREPASMTIADIDDDFISIHHWLKWYKFGFTRLFDNLSLEIRNGRMTREQAIRHRARNRGRDAARRHRQILRFAGIAEASSSRSPSGSAIRRSGGSAPMGCGGCRTSRRGLALGCSGYRTMKFTPNDPPRRFEVGHARRFEMSRLRVDAPRRRRADHVRHRGRRRTTTSRARTGASTPRRRSTGASPASTCVRC